MLSVVLVQMGNYLGRGAEYANRLARAVRAHLKTPHRIYCITDDAASNYRGMACKPADPRLPGWWQKLRLFKPGMFPDGRVMFLDLDTMIVGDIDDIASYEGDFATLHDFWRPQGLGPAVMLWRSGWGADIWESFVAAGAPINDPRGDQSWLEGCRHGRLRWEADILQERYPGRFVSYKTHCQKALPEGASVVCFHGKPRPHEVNGWAGEVWNG